MFSLCFIELQQMSNKLEKLIYSNALASYLCSVLKGGQVFRTQLIRGTHRMVLAPRLLLSLCSLLTIAQTDTPTQIQIKYLKRSALRNLGVI